MKNYNELEVPKDVKALSEALAKLSKQLKSIELRFNNEKDNLAKLEKRKKKLMGLAGEALSADQDFYDKYRVKIKRANAELEASQQMIEAFTKDIVPLKRKEVAETKAKLEIRLAVFCEDKVSLCEERITALIEPICKEKDDWMDFCENLHQEHGVTFKRTSLTVIPHGNHPRLEHGGNHPGTRGFRVMPFSV